MEKTTYVWRGGRLIEKPLPSTVLILPLPLPGGFLAEIEDYKRSIWDALLCRPTSPPETAR